MKAIRNKTVILLLLLQAATASFAVDIYLAPTGNDGSTGSPTDPVATLTRAYGLIPTTNAEHKIYVLGFIDITLEAAQPVNLQTGKYVTILGTDSATCGFDGKGSVALINLAGNNRAVTFRNLTFKNAKAAQGSALNIVNGNGQFLFDKCAFHDNTLINANGSANFNSGNIHIFRTNATFTNCSFYNNAGARGSVIWTFTDATTTIENCHFYNNTSTGNAAAIYQNGNAKVSIKSSIIENHDVSANNNSDGGAIYINNPNGFTVDGCMIRNNKVKRNGGAIYIAPGNNADSTVTIKNTLIANNESSGSSGGGVYIGNATVACRVDVSFINSTVYGNKTTQHGGGVYAEGAQPNSSLRFINCTVVNNESTNNNGGFGAGVSVRGADQNIKVYLYNSIFEDNFASAGGTSAIYSDFWFSGGTMAPQGEVGTNAFISNSFFGTNIGNLSGSITGSNKVNYGATHLSGLALPHADYIASQNSIPLDFDAEALEYGDAQYLQALNINTDQLDSIRTFRDGKCAVGAVEVPTELIVENPDGIDYQHFIIYGQSLSVGYQAYQSLSLDNVPGNYMLGRQVWLNYGNTDTGQLNPLVATSAITSAAIAECPITAAVNHIRMKQEAEFPAIDNRFIATSVGMGGKTVVELSRGNASNLYVTYFSALKAAYGTTMRSGSTICCPAIVWMQGEDDYTRTETAPTKAQYLADLVQLKNDMQGDVVYKYGQPDKPFFYTYQCGTQYTRGRELNVGMAQLEASNREADIFCVGPVYPVTDVGGHLDANGSRWYGEMIGKVYHKTKVLGEDFKPLQPKKLLRDASDPKKVIIQFLVPALPLVLDVQTLDKVNDYGFEVYNNNVRQTIGSVTIQSDSVIIACAADLNGRIEVVYAGLNASRRGHGNLRDSDDEKGFFHYIDPNLKGDDGEYVYPHYDNLASYTPASGEPKDEEGNVIYDRPYPLYNFSVAFYYAIPAGENKYEVPELNSEGTPTGFLPSALPEAIRISVSGSFLKIDGGEANGVSLFDVSGKRIKQFGNQAEKYNLSGLTAGIYIVKVQTDNGVQSQKIVL